MLSRIEIRNFAIIQVLDLDWSTGMTTITGETGAGKSIVVDALSLTLGERADQSVIYPNAKHAEVTALFDLPDDSEALRWLKSQDLDEDGECILRRVVVREGRSKYFINGRSTTQSQLKALGSLLVDIHGQHAHQTLLKTKEQLNLLDRYADHQALIDAVVESSRVIKDIDRRKRQLELEKQSRQARYELLAYQVEELETANPQQAILDTLEQEHKQAATSQDRLQLIERSLFLMSDDEQSAVMTTLSSVMDSVAELRGLDPKITDVYETFIQAENLLQEAGAELVSYRDSLDSDPEKLRRLDDQLAQFHDLARKHHVSLAQLPEHFIKLQQELSQLKADESDLQTIEIEYAAAITEYNKKAKYLTQSRQKTLKKLQQLTTEKLQGLAMDGGRFEIQLATNENTYSAMGNETVEFMVSANPGQPLQPLTKVASGGELSRISLAIAVITAEQQLVPTIIFDEVDVGIGGATAEVVGKLLNQLAQERQVICVTHQPQVASCGDQHLVASKRKQIDSTTTQVEQLTDEQRVEEIARMLGGVVISETTFSHAKEMLGR